MVQLGELDRSKVRADKNVPFKPGGFYANLVGLDPAWIFHDYSDGKKSNGRFPAKPGDATFVDPDIIKAGFAQYSELISGGLFVQLGQALTGTRIYELILDGGCSFYRPHQ